MNLSNKEFEQVSRILTKIEFIKEKDPDFKIFGSDFHKYIWNEPASLWDIEEFEKEHKIELPRDYKVFMTFISNGAPFVAYGLYPLQKLEVIGDLSKDNILYPHMTHDEFNTLLTTIEKDFQKDPTDEIYNGLLIIGTEGCTYDFALVVSGKYRGRLVLTDGNLDNPFLFSYDLSFLDLYERWLDAFDDDLDPNNIMRMIPLSFTDLINEYRVTEKLEYQSDILSTLNSYEYLNEVTINDLKNLYKDEEDSSLKSFILRILNKYDTDFSQNEFRKHLRSDEIEEVENFLTLESELLLFTDEDYTVLYNHLDTLSNRISIKRNNQLLSNFILAIRILRHSDYHTFENLKKYLHHEDEEVVRMAIFLISETSDFRKNKEKLYFLLESDDAGIINELLQVLINSTMSDEYLELFKPLVSKFNDDIYIPSLIERYLYKIKKTLDYYSE